MCYCVCGSVLQRHAGVRREFTAKYRNGLAVDARKGLFINLDFWSFHVALFGLTTCHIYAGDLHSTSLFLDSDNCFACM